MTSPACMALNASLISSRCMVRDFPKLVSLVEQGKLDLGSMVSRTMHLDEINDAFKAMQAGEVIRSVLV